MTRGRGCEEVIVVYKGRERDSEKGFDGGGNGRRWLD